MKGVLSNCIVMGVGKGNAEEAAAFYEKNLGFTRHNTTDEWIEMHSGPLRLFIVGDDDEMPMFELQVEDVDEATTELLAEGCEEIVFEGDSKERFIRDPYGFWFCVSSNK